MKEKDYNQLLVDFMFEKARILHSKVDMPNNEYFNNNDAIIILEWNKTRARKIYDGIYTNVKRNYYNDTGFCPFCLDLEDVIGISIEYKNCKRYCKYSKNHGICNLEGESHYMKWFGLKSITSYLYGSYDKLLSVLEDK